MWVSGQFFWLHYRTPLFAIFDCLTAHFLCYCTPCQLRLQMWTTVYCCSMDFYRTYICTSWISNNNTKVLKALGWNNNKHWQRCHKCSDTEYYWYCSGSDLEVVPSSTKVSSSPPGKDVRLAVSPTSTVRQQICIYSSSITNQSKDITCLLQNKVFIFIFFVTLCSHVVTNQTVNDGVAHSKNPRKCAYHVTFDLDLEHTLDARWPGVHLVQVWWRSGHLPARRSDLRKSLQTDRQMTDAVPLH